jgi:hypothetical protein
MISRPGNPKEENPGFMKMMRAAAAAAPPNARIQ